MKHRLLLPSFAILGLFAALADPGTARAQTPAERGFGLGVEALTLNIPAGAILAVYDLGQMRFEGLLGLSKPGSTLIGGREDVVVGLGARFHYVLHSTERSDISIGFGALLFASERPTGAVEILSQIRVFLVENVALQGALGFAVGFGGGSVSIALGGQVTGSFGLAYFF